MALKKINIYVRHFTKELYYYSIFTDVVIAFSYDNSFCSFYPTYFILGFEFSNRILWYYLEGKFLKASNQALLVA